LLIGTSEHPVEPEGVRLEHLAGPLDRGPGHQRLRAAV